MLPRARERLDLVGDRESNHKVILSLTWFGAETYLIFVALQCLAAPLAIFLTRPEKVQRSDGSAVRIVRLDSWRAEMVELWKLCRRKEVSYSKRLGDESVANCFLL